MGLEVQRDEYNGNVWAWKDVSNLFYEVQEVFARNPLLEGVTYKYETMELRFRKPRET